ncbi:MAG: hypothetical protein ACREOI_31125, partial [bacterium]
MKSFCHKIFFHLFALVFLLFFADAVFAQMSDVRSQIPVGARPRSMGDAFVAIADDGNAIAWNPAGLAGMEHIQASFAYADLFGLGLNSYYASFLSRIYFIPELTDYLSFGVDWFGIHLLDDDPVDKLQFMRDQFNFSLAFRPPRTVPYLRDFSIGANLKYLQLDGRWDDRAELDAKGWGWDWGFLYNIGALSDKVNGLQFGLVVQDGGGTEVKHARGEKEPVQSQNIRWGFSYRPFADWPGGKFPLSDPVLALDFDDRIHFGWEFWLARTLAIRAGVQKDFHTGENPTFSFGLGFKKTLKELPAVNVDYALTDAPILPNTNAQFGGSLILKANPRKIRIVRAQINNVFASLYRNYAQTGADFGSIKLENVSDDTLVAAITFRTNRYMRPQSANTVMIPPGRPIDFPLRAAFDPAILDAIESRLTGEVKVTYEYFRNQHTTSAAVDFALSGKNYLTWDDPGKAAAFVTFDDPRVEAFLAQVRRVKLDTSKAPWFFRYNMAEALTIFNALKAYGLTYHLDAVTPFPSLADTANGLHYRLDTIQYPAELLCKSVGDCDDLSVLYASLLQSAGLPTALVSAPGHLFMMFDTQIDTSQRRSLPIAPSQFIEHRGTLWIPVETTMIPSDGFAEAWAAATARYDTTCKIHEVAACQAKYPPIPTDILRIPCNPIPLPDFTSALQNDLAALEAVKDKWLQKVEDILELNAPTLPRFEAVKARNICAVLLGQNDEYARAKVQIQKIFLLDSANAPAWNNLGNLEFITGRFAEAERAYNKALLLNRHSRGTYLNLAMLYQMMINAEPQKAALYQKKTDEALLQAAQLLEGDSDSAYGILGLTEESTDGKASGLGKALKARIRKVKNWVDRAFRQHVQKKEIRGVALDRHGAK